MSPFLLINFMFGLFKMKKCAAMHFSINFKIAFPNQFRNWLRNAFLTQLSSWLCRFKMGSCQSSTTKETKTSANGSFYEKKEKQWSAKVSVVKGIDVSHIIFFNIFWMCLMRICLILAWYKKNTQRNWLTSEFPQWFIKIQRWFETKRWLLNSYIFYCIHKIIWHHLFCSYI